MNEPPMAALASSGANYPPHHQLVVDRAPRVQQWTCYRCGAEHQPEWTDPDEMYVIRVQRQRAKRQEGGG